MCFSKVQRVFGYSLGGMKCFLFSKENFSFMKHSNCFIFSGLESVQILRTWVLGPKSFQDL